MIDSMHSELAPEFMGVKGIDAYSEHDSQPRQTMFGSHITQAPPISGAMPIRDFTGVERQYGKYTHSVKMPVNAIIRRVIIKYPKDVNTSTNKHYNSPLVSVIYEVAISGGKELGVMHIPYHHCMHQYFGFPFKQTNLHLLAKDAKIPEGTIFAHSPSLRANGDYCPGIEAQLACMTTPSVIEDGTVARRGFLEQLKMTAYGTRTLSWGKNQVPLNMYGDDKTYKVHPDIGEFIRDDTILFATREYDEILAAVQMTPANLRILTPFDKPVHGVKNAKVINVEVFKGRPDRTVTLEGMNNQAMSYYNKTRHYADEVLDTYREATRRNNNEPPRVTPALEELMYKCNVISRQEKDGGRVTYHLNDIPLDEWTVKITFEYILTPTIGFKLSGLNGDKVVIVDIWDDEDMPIDSSGNRADLIQDPDGTNRRMNLGRYYRQYFGASMRITAMRAMEMLASGQGERATWEYLKEYYRIYSPRAHDIFVELYDKNPAMHLRDVQREGLRVWVPTDTPVRYLEVVQELEAKGYTVPRGPITYRGRSGNVCTTVNHVLIGAIYVLVLEKVGNVQSAVNSAKLQIFGVPAKVTAMDKFSSPGRQSAGRLFAETEFRLGGAYCGPMVIAELADQNNNHAAHRYIVNSILRHPHPGNMPRAIDRRVVPMNHGRVVQYVNNVLECAGVAFAKGEDDDHYISQTNTFYTN